MQEGICLSGTYPASNAITVLAKCKIRKSNEISRIRDCKSEVVVANTIIGVYTCPVKVPRPTRTKQRWTESHAFRQATISLAFDLQTDFQLLVFMILPVQDP